MRTTRRMAGAGGRFAPGTRSGGSTQGRPLLFTGAGPTAGGAVRRTAPSVLPADAGEQQMLFDEWVIQRWMPVATMSNDPAALAAFDWPALRRGFEEDYRRTGGRCVIPGRGATAEEMVLFLQLRAREPWVLLLAEEQPRPQLRATTSRAVWRADELVAVAMGFLAGAVDEPDPDDGPALPALLYDGVSAHVITLRSVNDDHDAFAYDDKTWPEEGGSLLAPGQNAAGCRAWYLGQAFGDWVVSAIDLARVIFGLPMPLRLMPDLEMSRAAYGRQLEEAAARMGFHR